jgi:hypothetical protein
MAERRATYRETANIRNDQNIWGFNIIKGIFTTRINPLPNPSVCDFHYLGTQCGCKKSTSSTRYIPYIRESIRLQRIALDKQLL